MPRDSKARKASRPKPPSFAHGLPGGTILLWLGIVAFLLCMGAGLFRSFAARRNLPRVGVEYTTELNELIRTLGTAATLPEVRSAARIDFDNEDALERLAESAREAGNADELVWALVALTRLRPEDPRVREELATVLLAQGRFMEAYSQARFSVWLEPTAASAHCNLGLALLGLGQREQAAMAFQRTLELDPALERARLGLDMALRGS